MQITIVILTMIPSYDSTKGSINRLSVMLFSGGVVVMVVVMVVVLMVVMVVFTLPRTLFTIAIYMQ